MSVAENNKRIAKNTLYMYFRMGLTLVVGLFTARVVLNALGVHDYGLYNVVGGFVGMLGYFNGLLGQGTTRFLTIGLGRGDIPALKRTFSSLLTMHLAIAAFTLLVGETIGLWFVNHKLVIEAGRMSAANYVYQLSLFSALLGIMQVPYSATVTSHERMSIYAYVSIFDVVMKLLVVFLLLHVGGDKLILYATFYFIVGIITIVFYRWYCIRNFEECSMVFSYDKQLYKDVFNYVGWNAIGTLAFMGNAQGMSVLLNMFFGTIVNTARGIAQTLCNYVNQFVTNFQTAVNPQTLKYYAAGEIGQMNHLIINNARYSSYLLLIVGLPVFLEPTYLLHLWLGQVPEYTVPFVRLTIIQLLVQAIDFPVGMGIHAYGKMRLPNLTSTVVYLMALPVTYVALKLGAEPVIAYVTLICVYPVALCFDLWILNKFSGFPVREYLRNVPLRTAGIALASAVLPVAIQIMMEDNLLRFFLVVGSSAACSAVLVYYCGLSKSMRTKVVEFIKKKLNR